MDLSVTQTRGNPNPKNEAGMDDEESRIDTLDTALAELLRQAPASDRRAAALAICSLAAHRTELSDERVDAAKEALAAGTVGDCPQRSGVAKLSLEWDTAAAKFAEDDDADSAYHEAFAKARAAAGFESAFHTDSYVAAGEAAYEASYAIGDARTVRVAVAKVLA